MWDTLSIHGICGKHWGNMWEIHGYIPKTLIVYIYIWKHIQITCPEINGTSVNSKFDHDISEVMISG